MPLVWKLTLLLLLVISSALAVNLALRVEREGKVFSVDMERDHALVSSWLAADVLEEWRDGGVSAARDVLLRRAGTLRAGSMTVRPIEASLLTTSQREQLAARKLMQEVIVVDGVETLRTIAPVIERGVVVLAFELLEPKTAVDAYVHTTIERALLTYFAMMAISALVVAVFGYLLVGKPVRALVDKARRTGAGDLDTPLPVVGRDELNMLARALNDMCDQLRAAHKERDDATEARIITLDRLRHADRLSTVGTLAAGIAHELGTPLHVVAGRAQLILDDDEASDRSKKHAQIVVEQTQRMTRIVRQLLDFSSGQTQSPQVQQAQKQQQKTSFDAHALAQTVVELLSMLAKKRGVTLVVGHATERKAIVSADADKLEQALTNIVMNAVQASPPDSTVTIDIRHSGDVISLAVTDLGVGITDEHKQRLFDPFFTTKDVGQGTGLGLAITWGLMHDLDGTVAVDSQLGHGSTFTLSLPAAPIETEDAS